MTPDQWQRLKTMLDGVLELETGAREAYLQQVCGADAELLARAESLIASSEETWTVFDGPASRLAGAEDAARVGDRIGAYEVLEEIGHGGMGTVYLGRRADEEFRKRVAIKVVRRGMDTDFVLRRFKAERQILAGLEHPNIARLLDGGSTVDGRPYFVMEYVEGQPLLEYCDVRRLSIAQRLKLFLDVCSAVQFAHQNLVVHRDLKPANLLATAGGSVKLLDFGIAKVLNPEMAAGTLQHTASVLRLMTPDYASPEQVRGEAITTSSDIYSLGVLLYELLTGHRPYRLASAEPAEVLRAVCERDPEKPSTAVTREEEVPDPEGTGKVAVTPESVSHTREGEPRKLQRRLQGDLDNIVLMAMRKEPQRRYSSVEQFAEDLRRHLGGRPVIARQDTVGYRAGKFVRRHRAGVAVAALAAAAAAAGLVWNLRETRRARAAEVRAERRFNDVRKLANSMLFEFHDSIEKLPGATPARVLLVKRGLEYLDSLSAESRSDPGLLRELASAYEKVGDLQSDNLGDADGALRSYRKALELRQSLAAREPGNREIAEDLARSYQAVSRVESRRGGKDASLADSRRALEIRERLAAANPGDRKAKRALAVNYHYVSAALTAGGDLQGSLKLLQREREIFEELLAAEPENPGAQRNAALSYKYLAGLLEKLEDVPAAVNYARKAVELDRKRADKSPNDAEAQQDLSYSYAQLGDCLKDVPSALAAQRSALRIRESLFAADPANRRAQTAFGRALIKTGNMQWMAGDHAGAVKTGERGVAVLEAAFAASPSDGSTRLNLASGRWDVALLHINSAALASMPSQERVVHLRRARLLDQRSLDLFLDMQKQGQLDSSYAEYPAKVSRQLAECEATLAREEASQRRPAR